MIYKYIVNENTYYDVKDLIGEVLINKKQEELKIENVILNKNSAPQLLIKGKHKKHILDESCYSNLKIERVNRFNKHPIENRISEDKELIKKSLKERGIKHLYHFTNIKNLKNILSEGLVTKNELKKYKEYHTNDNVRLDKTDAISLSLSFPNYKMFYRLRSYQESEKWVVIILDIDVLWKLNCSFFYTNAASKSYNNRRCSSLKTFDAFNQMFYNQIQSNPKITRSDLFIPDHYTTDPQAEILVFENIPKKYILKIGYSNHEAQKPYESTFDEFEHKIMPDLFRPREDYESWKSE